MNEVPELGDRVMFKCNGNSAIGIVVDYSLDLLKIECEKQWPNPDAFPKLSMIYASQITVNFTQQACLITVLDVVDELLAL